MKKRMKVHLPIKESNVKIADKELKKTRKLVACWIRNEKTEQMLTLAISKQQGLWAILV